jgi:hypothetical protein
LQRGSICRSASFPDEAQKTVLASGMAVTAVFGHFGRAFPRSVKAQHVTVSVTDHDPTRDNFELEIGLGACGVPEDVYMYKIGAVAVK